MTFQALVRRPSCRIRIWMTTASPLRTHRRTQKSEQSVSSYKDRVYPVGYPGTPEYPTVYISLGLRVVSAVFPSKGAIMKIFEHHPHPHIEIRKKHAPKPKALHEDPLARFNSFLGEKITKSVGTMWCAYAFA